MLPDVDDPLRARVLAALGLEVYFTTDPERADAVSAAGVEMARRLGDDEALAFCLACRHTAIFDPSHLHDRLDVAAELIEVGTRIANPEFALTGRVHRACDLLELARVDDARAEAAVCATLVEELGQPALRYFVLWFQSTLALLDGQFDDAEKLAQESFDLGVAAKHPDAAVVFGTQTVILAWQRGDTTELVEPTLDILTRVPDLPAWRSALALVLALGGRPEEARAELLRVAHGLGDLAFSSTFTPALVGLAEVARLLDEPAAAAPDLRRAGRLRRPDQRDQPEPQRDGPDQPRARRAGGVARRSDARGAAPGGCAGHERRIALTAACNPNPRRPRPRAARTAQSTATSSAPRELLDVALLDARELGMARVLLDALELKSKV